nr:L,D-transpeptidase family protein [Pseudomonadota bacterium]
RHGLLEDGVVGPLTQYEMNVPAWERVRQIVLNLERWRWLPEDLGRRFILVNITDYALAVVEDGRRVLESRVVVGRSKRPTPVFTGTLSHLVLNPYWRVPRTIAVEDMLPQLQKDPYALARQNIRVFDAAAGREIDPGGVDWSRVNKHNFNFLLRQDPGPGNALGRIKFMFPNRHAVYLHDTSSPRLFNRNRRSYSSGCVRVSKAWDLAEYLLRDDPRWSRETLQAAASGRREKTVHLPQKIPIHLMYWTAWVDDEGLAHFRNDIYKHDETLAQVLTATETVLHARAAESAM